MVRFSFVVCVQFALAAFAAPSTPSLLPRDATTTIPGINATATILDHNGLDISSSFKIKVYRQPSSGPVANDLGNELNGRQTGGTQFAQLVNACPVNETFVSSHCDLGAGGESAMQKYLYTCRRTEYTYSAITGNIIGSRPVYRIRDGHCQPYEICITTHQPRLIATCVQSWLFDDYSIDKDGTIRPMLGGTIFTFEGMALHSAVSESDKSTPVELDKFNVKALTENRNVQSKECRDCMELSTDALEPKINSLTVEASLLTAGTMTGVLWLGFMFG